jgi:hypothetical protein
MNVREEHIEKIAQALYHSSSGLNDEDYVSVHGKPRELWENIDQWRREEYRFQAQAAYKVFVEHLAANMAIPIRCTGLDYK